MKKFSQISGALTASVLLTAAVSLSAHANNSDITGPNVSDITGPNVSDVTSGLSGDTGSFRMYTIAEAEQLAEAIQRAYKACENEREDLDREDYEGSDRDNREGSNLKNRDDTDHQSRLYFDRELDREDRQVAAGQQCSELLRLLNNAFDILGRNVISTAEQAE